MRRFSPVSFAISRRLIAPDSYRPRNRLSSNQRCGSKTTLAALHRPRTGRQKTRATPTSPHQQRCTFIRTQWCTFTCTPTAHITGHPRDLYHLSCRRPLNAPAILHTLTASKGAFSLDFHLPSAAEYIEAATPWLDAAHTVFVNQAEYRILTQHATSSAIAELIVTDGPRPARLLTHGTERASCKPPATSPIDVTGAGDTLAGTYLAHRAAGTTPGEALTHAVQAASRHTTTPRLPLPHHT
ncbi:carbohydrate kinase family protein [Streptomyces telluris]|uniref:Carbohydrate kinase family protein n=1 Tax=Streptomyces telluris TaxID=2720021 RepID=A0A9X2LKW6_9ACTN|nr:carbohydrate kinase family protein [Streptomyces telluris]MCQ8773080.1 carbohydrate kinase family protein [Streptomyces telluris]NJP81870.1 carbohydrate kinase family protein [Streptomyces telluris]